MGPLQLSAHRRSCYREITTIDAHTEGEPLRIITGGYPEVQGHSMVEKRQYLMTHLDEYRQLLMHEPRGHADIYGAFITGEHRFLLHPQDIFPRGFLLG